MPAVLGEARNLLGDPVSNDIRKRIQRFLNHPGCESWDDIHGIAIAPFTTVWQAVLAIDPSFPSRGRLTNQRGRVLEEWSAIPLPLTVMRAIRTVVSREGLQ